MDTLIDSSTLSQAADMNISDTSSTRCVVPSTVMSRENTQLFINRELSWIKFNHRVLAEARSAATPLLERVKFLGILSANVDEFYMKRMGGLKQKIAMGKFVKSCDHLSYRDQMDQCRHALRALQMEKEQACSQIRMELLYHNIEICEYELLEEDEKAILKEYYLENIEPLIDPWMIDSKQPFPFISNLSLNLIVSLQHSSEKPISLVQIKVPTGNGLSRFVPVGNSTRFVVLEDIIAAHIRQLYPQALILAVDKFRVTRTAISQRDYSELDDRRQMLEEELHDRKYASVVRLQVSPSIDQALRRSLTLNLGLDHEGDVFESHQILRMSDFREIAALNVGHLRDAPHVPAISTALNASQSIFTAIRKQVNIVLQHPYESFAHSVEGFVREASQNSNVAAISMTLYRTSADTRIIEYLIAAVKNGKKVSVLVELTARFDEASNLKSARLLEHAGVQVSHGFIGLKTHCKCILVEKYDSEGLSRYAHIGTGNYHAGTAQLYSDIGLLTCEDALTADIKKLFTYMTDTVYCPNRQFSQIMATPHIIKNTLLAKIDNQINKHSNRMPGYICMKTNALEDSEIILALYKASQAGVKVDLIVRDICRLRPGIAGVSDNIRIISIVGRFLEHSRLYRFRNGDDEEVLLGSADLMTRNLERRVELLIPVTDAASKQLLCAILTRHLHDNCYAWEMQADGNYNRRTNDSDAQRINSQSAAVTIDQHCSATTASTTDGTSPSRHVQSQKTSQNDVA